MSIDFSIYEDDFLDDDDFYSKSGKTSCKRFANKPREAEKKDNSVRQSRKYKTKQKEKALSDLDS